MPDQTLIPQSRRRRMNCVGWSCSLAAHGLASLLLAFWVIPHVRQNSGTAIDSRWNDAQIVDAAPLELPADELESLQDPGSLGHDLEFELSSAWLESSTLLLLVDPQPPLVSSDIATHTPRPSNRRRPVVASTFVPKAQGTGTGEGAGTGADDGFFGMPFELGQRVVFVVDNSRSMNHPHDSPAKTRYRRLKQELVRCILEMKSHQSFYVVFFSNTTTPMPAQGLQPATDAIRRPLLYWIARLPSGGAPTDPLDALELGLALRPDVICFLTDGDFPPGINRKLSAITQDRTAIHTFAFGNTEAEEALRGLAERNAGEYRFVP